LALFASLLVLLLLPLINTSAVRSSLYRPLYQKFFWFLVADFFLLSYLGQAPAESPYIEVGQIATIYYFGFFILLVPILGRLEKNPLPKTKKISGKEVYKEKILQPKY
jgi:ubiquinol-cytochrome c reductase cytochrome b subunit